MSTELLCADLDPSVWPQSLCVLPGRQAYALEIPCPEGRFQGAFSRGAVTRAWRESLPLVAGLVPGLPGCWPCLYCCLLLDGQYLAKENLSHKSTRRSGCDHSALRRGLWGERLSVGLLHICSSVPAPPPPPPLPRCFPE